MKKLIPGIIIIITVAVAVSLALWAVASGIIYR